jgi:hypothetical protein
MTYLSQGITLKGHTCSTHHPQPPSASLSYPNHPHTRHKRLSTNNSRHHRVMQGGTIVGTIAAHTLT